MGWTLVTAFPTVTIRTVLAMHTSAQVMVAMVTVMAMEASAADIWTHTAIS